ncbi:hypothetical protein EIKCOROL_02078 [Eikenella corrodens ATCC 23834]|uniref:Uncharacterized protein n=1 Tax=Eikenella corrodens ATCC 23834 TaxID=546274 RepID=C0DXH1_EIKCO|nr:hypothetical protein EIKCOROL_02078 [Eikenella corrodens ATCC 23834]
MMSENSFMKLGLSSCGREWISMTKCKLFGGFQVAYRAAGRLPENML